MEPLHYRPIADLAGDIAAKRISPVELTRSLIARIEAHDGRINAVLTRTAEQALAQAKASEADIMAGRHRGPLHGIPFGLKDIVDTAGIRTTAHSRLLEHNVPAADAQVTKALYAAGGVLLAKLATHEFALGGPSWDLPWPPARNPWDAERLPSGSSSGSGAALAAGFLPMAIGTDTGGSIRGPAAVCGIVGLKPTYGRVSRRGVYPNTFTFDNVGPMTRTVEDCALMLQAIAGFDPDDPGSADRPVPDFRASLRDGVAGLRLALARGWYAAGAHPDVAPAVDAAVEVLRGLGATVEEIDLPPLQDYHDCKTTISIAELYAIHEPWLRTRPQDYGSLFRNRVLPGALIRAEDYVQAMRWRLELCRGLERVLKRFDAILTAGGLGIGAPAVPVKVDALMRSPNITMPFSVGGNPALCLPCGFSRAEGMPLSLQIGGRPFDEATVFRIAWAYEQATDWHRRHPAF